MRKIKNFLQKRNENSEENLRPNEESDNLSTSGYIDQKKEPLSEPPSLLLNERFLLDKKNEEDELLSNILEQIPSFSVEWKSLRGVTQCSCGSPIDYLTRKVRCLQFFSLTSTNLFTFLP